MIIHPDPAGFIRANTAIASPSMVPELRLHLASEITPIWRATEQALQEAGIEPPYWAFCWPGGQALARLVLDRPELVAGRRVIDFASGSGVTALAAARAGAAHVLASDIDQLAVAAIGLNAALNGLRVEATARDLLRHEAPPADIVLAGDVCYEECLAGHVFAWLRARAASGALVLLGDPGRHYLPSQGLEEVARYAIPTSLQLENRGLKETVVWRVLP